MLPFNTGLSLDSKRLPRKLSRVQKSVITKQKPVIAVSKSVITNNQSNLSNKKGNENKTNKHAGGNLKALQSKIACVFNEMKKFLQCISSLRRSPYLTHIH